MDRVIVFGRRSPLIAALRRLGRRPLLVDPTARHGVAAGPGPEAVRALARRLRRSGAHATAVIAAGEKWVPTASEAARRLGVPGLEPVASLTVRDKVLMKRLFASLGIPHARWTTWPGTAGGPRPWEDLVAEVGLPVVIKPRLGSGGVGKRTVGTRREVARELALGLARHPAGLIIEEHLAGLEVSLETFVAGSAVAARSATEYVAYGAANLVGDVLPPRLAPALLAWNDRLLSALGVRGGMTHVEVFLTAAGPRFSEIAARPPGGHLMELIGRAGDLDAWELFARCALSPGEPLMPEVRLSARRFAANLVLHPAPGVIREVHGLSEVRELAGVERVDVRFAPGDVVPPRRSLGQTRGEVTFAGPDAQQLRRSLRAALELLRIKS